MRITDEKTLTGYFWLPGQSDRKIPGILKIADGGNVELETVGNFDAGIQDGFKVMEVKRIHGQVEEEGAVTLDDCLYKTKNLDFGEIHKSIILSHRTYLGAWLEAEVATFHSFRFSVEGLDEWLTITGIKVDYDLEKRSVTINYEAPKEESFKLKEDLNFKFSFNYTIPGMPITTEAKVSQKAYIEISSENALPLNDYIAFAHKITNFMCFVVDKTVSINSVSLKHNDFKRELSSGQSFHVQIGLIYPSLPFSESSSKISWHHTMLFHYPSVKERFENIISRWLDAYETIEPAMNLYFASRTGAHRFLNGRFLSLAQCLETFHRHTCDEIMLPPDEFDALKKEILRNCPSEWAKWLNERLMHGNELNLRKRLTNVFSSLEAEFGDKKVRTKIINSIVDTRNYFTHYSAALKERRATDKALYSLCMKMEAAFQLHLLLSIGLTGEELSEIVSKNANIRYKIKGS